MARTLDDIVEALRRSKGRDMGCTLLLGAGCSKTAGIPLAGGIVDDIRKNTLYERVYQRALDRARRERNPHAVEPSYGECMTEMEKGDQRALIRSYIDAARLNWAHAGIAALIKHGYVGRVLTTNFDPLVARACSVFNELPGVYDLTMSDIRNYKELPDKAIFHLHGQRYGFSMLNNPDELERHKRSVEPLFKHAREGRTWIVCGYSGENDPLFDLIKSCDEYDHALYWIGREPDPPAHVQALLSGAHAKGCHYLQFAGADEFFFRLCGALDIADFPFMHRPLEHIEEILAQFVDFPSAATDSGIDLLGVAKASIEYHKNAYFQASAQEAADQRVSELIASQGHAAAASAISQDTSLAARISPLARARLKLLEGVDLYQKAEHSNDPTRALELYRRGNELNATALQIKPDFHEALYNWGLALATQARRSPEPDANRLWAEAGEKYAAALAIKPDIEQALNNWGTALAAQAERSPGPDAHRLWAEACEKYAAALAIKPGMHEALYNWGNALAAQAERSPDPDAHRLWAEACDKFAAALAIKPDKHEALNNWGNALVAQAERSSVADANRLWAEACDKFAAALAIKPDDHEALNNWGAAFAAQAERSPDPDAHRLWAEAREKYAAALAIKPDMHEALYNCGNALAGQAERRPGPDAQRLWAEAGEKYAAALAIKPDDHEALNNWGNALNAQAQRSSDPDAHRLWTEACDKYAAAHAIKPDKHEALNNWGNALNAQAQRSPDPDAHRLWAEACDKFAAALAIKPDLPEALNNWGAVLCARAKRSPDPDAHRLWAEACDKFAAALAIKPDLHEVLNNWGIALLTQAHRGSGEEHESLLRQAEDKLTQSEAIAPGSGAYNLACVYAMRGALPKMVEWLERSQAAGNLPTREHIAEDKDFDAVRDTPEFKAWLTKMGWVD